MNDIKAAKFGCSKSQIILDERKILIRRPSVLPLDTQTYLINRIDKEEKEIWTMSGKVLGQLFYPYLKSCHCGIEF